VRRAILPPIDREAVGDSAAEEFMAEIRLMRADAKLDPELQPGK